MKANFIKIVIPAFAIVLAVAVSSFTISDGSETDKNALITGYYPSGNPLDPCIKVENLNCKVQGDQLCTYGILPVFEKIQGSMCANRLSRSIP
jgi:hypothetical protein